MAEPTAPSCPTNELDVRDVPKSQRHPLIFERFAALAPAGWFVLVSNHDPKHLRAEFDRDQVGAFDWHYLESGRPGGSASRGRARSACRVSCAIRRAC